MSEEHTWGIDATRREQTIAQVREGMQVVDVHGEELGTVEFVKMGDPEAATTRGSAQPSNDLVEIVAEAFTGGEPELPEPKRAQLLRYGFIKIDGPDFSDTDRYVRSDRIREVSADTVFLTVSKEQLPSEE